MYFIGNFQYVSNQQSADESDRRHGGFSMMVEADDAEMSLGKFREKLIAFRDTTAIFEGNCTIYVAQLLEFDTFPSEEAVIVNLNSYAGDPVMPYISCVFPDEQNNSCTIHEWSKNHPTTEGLKDRIMIQFNVNPKMQT
jgi:hypothetical protein